MKVSVLRLGHRFVRDKRISTHLCLVARAFGADEIIFDVEDNRVKESVDKVIEQWGGEFKIGFIKNWKNFIRDFKGEKIHLTMYGININSAIKKLDREKDKLIIVGGKKVPSEVYSLADYNIAVGNAPHSEVAALSVFLDRLFEGSELEKEINKKMKIIPLERGKKVIRIQNENQAKII